MFVLSQDQESVFNLYKISQIFVQGKRIYAVMDGSDFTVCMGAYSSMERAKQILHSMYDGNDATVLWEMPEV